MYTLKEIYSNKITWIIIVLVGVCFVLSLTLFGLSLKTSYFNYGYNIFLAGIPTVGFFAGIRRMKEWGGLRSQVGKIIFLVSLGLAAWALGAWVWAYYTFFKAIEVPYPSLAELFYLQVYFYWGVGLLYFSRLITKKDITRSKEKIFFVLVPLIMAIVTYYFIFVDLHGGNFWTSENSIKVFTDIMYPLGDVMVILIVAIVMGMEMNYLGKRLRLPFTLLVAGLTANYVADFVFSYSTSTGLYYNAHPTDLLFAVSLGLISFSVNSFTTKLLKDE